MLVPCSLKLINQACPDPEQRTRAVGLWVGCGGVAMAAGPLVGGILIQWFGWRSIFFVNVPIGLLGMLMTWRIAEDARPVHRRSFDLPGQVSAIVALATLIGVLIEGKVFGWYSPPIVVGFLVSIASWAIFFVIEKRTPQPMLPLSFFQVGVFTGSTFASMASAFVFYGTLFVVSLYYQEVRTYSPFSTGMALLPMTSMVALERVMN